jgi:hypothetical protein
MAFERDGIWTKWQLDEMELDEMAIGQDWTKWQLDEMAIGQDWTKFG